jgi:hypothetical protein
MSWGRWWRWHGGRQGPRLVSIGASLPRCRCPRPRHRSCSSRRRCRLHRRRSSGAGMSPHLVPFSQWLTGRRLASLPPPIDAPALGATLLPASPSHVGSSHLREEREYTNFHSWKGGPELSAPALLEPTKVPHNAQKSHIGADAGCAGNGLSGRTNARPGPWLSVTALLRFLGREAPC